MKISKRSKITSSKETADRKTDRRISPTNVRYRGYMIRLDRGGDGYNVYDKHGELEDAGYTSLESAKKLVDELVNEAKGSYVRSSIDEDPKWICLDIKYVRDSDGMLTDYALYTTKDEDKYICMFGDADVYAPDEMYADAEFDTEDEALEWFENYVGPGDEEDEDEYYDILESTEAINSSQYPYRQNDLNDKLDTLYDRACATFGEDLVNKIVVECGGPTPEENPDYWWSDSLDTEKFYHKLTELFLNNMLNYEDFEDASDMDMFAYNCVAEEYGLPTVEDLDSPGYVYDPQKVWEQFRNKITNISSTSDIKASIGRYDDYFRQTAAAAEFESDEDDLEHPDQEYDSAATSINSTKLPAIYRMIKLEPGTVGVDFGGGRFDNAVEYLRDQDVTLCVYDPYNRSAEHNREVLRTLRANGGADFAINSNVLNVIKEPEARKGVLENIKKITKSGAPIYITVYEGRGDAKEGVTKSGYQLNRKTADYLEEIQEVFPDAKRKGKLIVATNKGSANSSVDIKASSEIIWDDLDWNQQIQVMKRYIRNYKGTRIFEDFADYINKPVEDIIDSFCDAESYGDIKIPERMQLDSEYRNDDIYSSSSVGGAYYVEVNSTRRGTAPYEKKFSDFNSAFSFAKKRGNSKTTIYIWDIPKEERSSNSVPNAVYNFDSGWQIIRPVNANEDRADDEIYSSTTSSSRYWYFTRHGVQPGSVPKYVNILDIVDKPEGSYFLADGVILTKDLRDYDIKERKPEDSVTSSTRIEYSDILEEIREQCNTKLIHIMAQYGFDESEAKQYSRVDASIDDQYGRIEIGCELDYDGLMRVCQELDPIVQAYDPDSYFEPVDSGIAEAWINLEKASIDSSSNIQAGAYDFPEPSLDPPEYPEPEEVDDYTQKIDLNLDAVIEIDQLGNWEYQDENYPWARCKDTKDGSWYSDEYDVFIADPVSIVERVDELLISKLPEKEGTYRIKGNVHLEYVVSNLSKYVHSYGPDDYEEDIDTDNAYVDFDFYNSNISNFRLKKM